MQQLSLLSSAKRVGRDAYGFEDRKKPLDIARGCALCTREKGQKWLELRERFCV